MASAVGAPLSCFNLKLNSTRYSASPLRWHLTWCRFTSSSRGFSTWLTGVPLRLRLNFQHLVVERGNLLKVQAGKAALGCTKRSRSRKSRARTHGFRIRMRTASGRRVLKRRRMKGRKNLVPQTNPNSGKRA